MKNITEQQILSAAPNPAAAANGKKISKGGSFTKLYKSADDTFFMGECKGSGKNPYMTSADYIDPAKPVFRCSCPSRQFPCKHSLGLMYEMMADKTFEPCEIPEDIIRKRSRKAAANAPSVPDDQLSPEELAKKEKRKAAAAKTSARAKTAKLKKQLEGIDLCEKAVSQLLTAGLGTMGGASLSVYADISKQLGDYYLTGLQGLMNTLVFEIKSFQKDSLEIHYDNAVEVLKKLNALIKRSRKYLTTAIEGGEASAADDVLFEELGGVWKTEELIGKGYCTENARLTQLAFRVEYDEALKEYTDIGVWTDINSGRIYLTKNYRPVKSLKYIKADDSVFGAVDVPSLAVYPGEGSPRVRWNAATYSELSDGDFDKLRGYACTSINGEMKAIKDLLKNVLQSPLYFKTVKFSQIGSAADKTVLKQACGDTIILADPKGCEKTVQLLYGLPDDKYLRDGIMLCGIFYDNASRTVCAYPLSIIPDCENAVIRLLY